ncbi:box C/D snoRNA protein 1 isoform X1 [Alexandromys fortis]|uniref:box C/D snoRNA protein 1 isoform X1 n=1 Tax=Alexandromys fortis TaxID=100897 RepID=UPI0021527344|nr:box C/D snoRNA protein 1 isoform X1 [Microtus fortis]
MELAAEKEGTPGGGPQRVAEGARPRPEAGGEGAWDLGGSPEAGVGEERIGLAGVETTEDAEEIKVDLAVVKQEVVDWSDVDGGISVSHWVKQEVEGGPEVKDEKVGAQEVKQETDGSLEVKEETVDAPEVKEEKVKVKEEVTDWEEVTEDLNVKPELFVGQNVKEEQVLEGVRVKEDDCLKREEMDGAQVKEEPQTKPRVGCKRKLAMSRCGTCGTEEAKYRCPRCMRYSCSLRCVKKHKAELTCNGVRNRTAYVSLQQFTEMNLLSDYRFLEDVARTADQVSRDTFLKKPKHKKYLFFMKNRARKQGIFLRLLPNGFSKRKENSTVFDHRKQQFCWHVKLQFPQSQAEYVEKRVPDNKTINEILKPYIDPEKSDPVIRQRLKAYVHSQTGIQILMRVENMQQNIIRYYELDPDKSLLDNLRNKVIIEYPTLHVVLKGSISGVQLLHQVKSESPQKLGEGN